MDRNRAIKLIKELSEKYFPELGNEPHRVYFVSKVDYYMAVRWKIISYHLYINNQSLKFSEPAFKGCLAHELAHIKMDKELSFWKRVTIRFLNHDETQIERSADNIVVEKELGAELLQFHQNLKKMGYKAYNSSEGLTPKEIRNRLRRD